MSLNDGAAYRQPHPCSTGLRGVEGVEDSIEMRRINAWPGIAYGHEGVCLALLGADHQLSNPLLNRAHCFSRVQNQVQQDLLQLNAIPQNRKQSIRKPGLTKTPFLWVTLCANTSTSLIAALRSKRSFRGGAFLT